MSSRVLIDSSAWIKFFKAGDSTMESLIKEDMVCTNELILTELIPILVKQGQHEVVNSLHVLVKIPLNVNWDLIREYQLLNLNNGINKVGLPDLIILQQVIENKLSFYTLDKHFALMQKHLTFELISTLE